MHADIILIIIIGVSLIGSVLSSYLALHDIIDYGTGYYDTKHRHYLKHITRDINKQSMEW